MADAVNRYNKPEHKWKKDLKALKKQNKVIYSISKKSGSRRELNKINKINSKASKKRSYSSRDSSRSGSNSGSYISIDID